MMRDIESWDGTRLRIPSAWDVFTFRGYLYVADGFGHFVMQPLKGVDVTPQIAVNDGRAV